jgi:hypothetical protein
MRTVKNLNYKLLLAKFLLAGILFFSFITIAGYNRSSDSILRQNGQTELIYSHESPDANKTVLYGKRLFQKNQVFLHSHFHNLILLLVYNKLAKVKFDSHSKKVYSISMPEHLFPINNTPQNSEDYLISFSS